MRNLEWPIPEVTAKQFGVKNWQRKFKKPVSTLIVLRCISRIGKPRKRTGRSHCQEYLWNDKSNSSGDRSDHRRRRSGGAIRYWCRCKVLWWRYLVTVISPKVASLFCWRTVGDKKKEQRKWLNLRPLKGLNLPDRWEVFPEPVGGAHWDLWWKLQRSSQDYLIPVLQELKQPSGRRQGEYKDQGKLEDGVWDEV